MKCIRRVTLPHLWLVLVGCSLGESPGDTNPTPSASASVLAGRQHDPSTAGAITGRVIWDGPVPQLSPETVALPDGTGGYKWTAMPPAFTPAVDSTSRGLAGAVITLRGLDPARGRPWDLPPVQVEQRGLRIQIQQGAGKSQGVGFVRRGDEVEFISHDPGHHAIRARGSAYFTLPFPDPDRPLRRRLDQAGLVSLTSGAGHFWEAADLFVDDHPYYALTDHTGQFRLPAVPPGEYQLVCWVRNWHLVGQDRDPESGLVFRQHYAAPVEKQVRVTLAPRQEIAQTFTLQGTDFEVHSQR